MCLAYLAISAHPEWPLFIAANRDEFHRRSCLPAAPWLDHPNVIAGRDILANGTWLGMTRNGRYALLTNYRDPSSIIAGAPSRGDLTRGYLTGDLAPQQYASQVYETGSAYNGFNLIVGDAQYSYYVGNRSALPSPQLLVPGRYIISNHLLDTPWPKAERLRRALDAYPLERLEGSLADIFELLKDGTLAEDHALPSTGLSLERERLLSSPFIISPDYGTRCSTVIAIHASGHAIFSEVSYDAQGQATQRHDWPISIQP